VCAFAVDILGSGAATFFGCAVSTSDAAARLATVTNAAIVPGVTLLRDGAVVARALSPIYARDFSSVAELHQALLTRIERELGSDPAQLVKDPFPTASTADAVKERARLDRKVARARDKVQISRERWKSADARLSAARAEYEAAKTDREKTRLEAARRRRRLR
jgi:hypothetical protein